jgi:hypothetical protein
MRSGNNAAIIATTMGRAGDPPKPRPNGFNDPAISCFGRRSTGFLRAVTGSGGAAAFCVNLHNKAHVTLSSESSIMANPTGESNFKEYDYDVANLPQEVLQAIGLVTAYYAQIEGIVELAIGGCAGLEIEYGLAITTHMNAPLRDHVLRAAAQIRIDDLDDLDELDRLLDQIKIAGSKRNLYVHGSWCRDPDTCDVFIKTIEARGEVDAALIQVSVDKIKTDAIFIYDTGINLMKFLMARRLFPTIPPSKRARAHKSKAAREKRKKG